MKNQERKFVAAAVTLFSLSLGACGGGGSSTGGGGGTGGPTSTVVVSSTNLADGPTEGMSRVARVLGELLVRSAEAVVTEVTVSGGELGEEGRVFTPNSDGDVYIPLLGDATYTFCVLDDGVETCTPFFVDEDSVVLYNADTGERTTYPAEDDVVVGDFTVSGQEHKRIICHKDRNTLQVASAAVYDAHKAHGDRAGSCDISTADSSEPSSPGNGGQPKVTVCHEGKELSVPESAEASHLAHGDTAGGC